MTPEELEKLNDPNYLQQRHEMAQESQGGEKGNNLDDVIAAEQKKRKRKQAGSGKVRVLCVGGYALYGVREIHVVCGSVHDLRSAVENVESYSR